ncbi:hypothetical protein FACS189430_04100 [Bacteroidia bacterium]|nr:hypothetical protein FACS189430_04100 [Bacteroidia bacterium]
MEKEKQIVKEEFDIQNKLFAEHFNNVESMLNLSLIWSDSFPDFYPYRSEMNQYQPIRYYKNRPKTLEGKILNKYENDKFIYSAKYGKETWGQVFYLYEYGIKKRLLYIKEKDEYILSQLDYLIASENIISKRLFLMRVGEKETFMLDNYSYDVKGRIHYITRDSYLNNEDNILPVRTFRFEYDEHSKVTIFSKQLKLNGDYQENQIYREK